MSEKSTESIDDAAEKISEAIGQAYARSCRI